MAIYQRLSLNDGGGIIAPQQQAEQVENTATILIGLGGTGIDCLRTIKTEVYNRLKPDDVNAVKPEYEHIRFLGVDTEGWHCSDREQSSDILPLEDDEFFSIAMPNIMNVLQGHPLALQLRDELNWLEYEKIDPGIGGVEGAGGLRQVGRFMFMEKSNDFFHRLEMEINRAKMGLANPTVNVHVFTGLGGGTGSGCFLDVCYMVRHVLEQFDGGKVFGYCFMPDVSLSKIPLEALAVRSFIPGNGYAAMQELDYCMNLPKNGGEFEQAYKGGIRIAWNQPPVDMCHLISATNIYQRIIGDAYNSTMRIAAEYVLNFLTAAENPNMFSMQQHLANYHAIVAHSNNTKTVGANMNYCSIGAASAYIPFKEINTYLASELFKKLSRIGRNTPTRSDVEELAMRVLASPAANMDEVYQYLQRKLRDNAGDDYNSYSEDWKYVREHGNGDMITHYTSQTAEKLNRMEANAKRMLDESNASSLIAKLREELKAVLKDVNRGPIYGYEMLSAAQSHNLLNIVDGLIAENDRRLYYEAVQAEVRHRDYENSKSAFEARQRSSLFESDKTRFERYEWFLLCFEHHKLYMEMYRKYDEVLKSFRRQIEQITCNYYIKLYRVMNNLIVTFEDNSLVLNYNSVFRQGTLSIPLVTIEEIKETLDKEVYAVDVSQMMDLFMTEFLEHESDWILEDENRIYHLVNRFFTEKAFPAFANRSITTYLQEKYNNSMMNIPLSDYIHQEWMRMITANSAALFPFDPVVMPPHNTTKLGLLSVPAASPPVLTAAGNMQNQNPMWIVQPSRQTDRMTAISISCGFPLAAFAPIKDYEQAYFARLLPGRHLYEGRPIAGMKFSDWRKLPPITPRCMIHIEDTPLRLREILTLSDRLYDRAKELHVLDDEGYLCRLRDDAIADRKEMEPQSEQTLTAELERTPYRLPADGFIRSAEDVERFYRDYFTAFPAFQVVAEEIIGKIETLLNENCEKEEKRPFGPFGDESTEDMIEKMSSVAREFIQAYEENKKKIDAERKKSEDEV